MSNELQCFESLQPGEKVISPSYDLDPQNLILTDPVEKLLFEGDLQTNGKDSNILNTDFHCRHVPSFEFKISINANILE
jgi:hypothetical protein